MNFQTHFAARGMTLSHLSTRQNGLFLLWIGRFEKTSRFLKAAFWAGFSLSGVHHKREFKAVCNNFKLRRGGGGEMLVSALMSIGASAEQMIRTIENGLREAILADTQGAALEIYEACTNPLEDYQTRVSMQTLLKERISAENRKEICRLIAERLTEEDGRDTFIGLFQPE